MKFPACKTGPPAVHPEQINHRRPCKACADPAAKHLPEFATLKTPSGKPANLTVSQILTHISGREGVAEMLSPGSFGHGGAWGTQAWIDPVKGVAYVLMVQRSNFPNSDASDVRREFQKAAATALAKTR